MSPLDPTQLHELIDHRNHRAIAAELVSLESLRGVVSMADLGEFPDDVVISSPELELEYDSSPRAGCSVYGYYKYRIGAPAVIFVHPAHSVARDSFTIVHEYGHHVQRQHAAWANILFAIPRAAAQKLEERVADAFAAEVLIPADLVSADSTWLNARVLSEVHQNVRASRSAVAMRAVEIAPANDNATVVVCDNEGVVIFARAAGDDVFTPARGIVQPGLAALFARAQQSDGAVSSDVREGLSSGSNWIQGDIQGELAIDYSGMYGFVVLRSNQKYGRIQTWDQSESECANPACELVFTVDELVIICRLCKEPRCPSCATCSCEPAAAAVCTDCFFELSVAEQAGELMHECQ